MDEIKEKIQQELAANIIIEKCRLSQNLVFSDAWCTQKRVIRFTTPFFRNHFAFSESNKGKWKTGDYVMYECLNGKDAFVINCVMNLVGASSDENEKGMLIYKAMTVPLPGKNEDALLHSWGLTSFVEDTNKLSDEFDYIIDKEIPSFEKGLADKLAVTTLPEELKEGELDTHTLNKYERNKKAREACLLVHGTACAVCGIDFGKEYGPEFAGKIEVHHIVPLSDIGKEYVVDPIKDLIPVCPNCHTALHSKKNGVYTVEELKTIIDKNTQREY